VIAPDDRVELAPGVTMSGHELVDAVRGVRMRLNPAAAIALREKTPRQMAAALAARYAIEQPRLEADVRVLCTTLNCALLLNVRVATPRLLLRWLWTALMLTPVRGLPRWPPKRVGVRTTSATATIATVARGALGASIAAALVTGLPFAAVSAPRVGLSAGVAAACGVVLHEAGHAFRLRGIAAVLVVRGVRVALLHERLDRRREALIAAAGPCAVVCAALAALAASHLIHAQSLALVPCVLGVHALGLTALAPDGRKICVAC
jgi:hypothetical protein